MAQAKGVLPRRNDKVIANPTSNGYFVGVRLRADITREETSSLLGTVTSLVERLVAKVPHRRLLITTHDWAASVAVGFAPNFFARFSSLQHPACFDRLPMAAGQALDYDMLLYVVTPSEARACAFINGLWDLRRDISTITIDRGYQRSDGTEHFGFADGVRNVRRSQRPGVVFVDSDRHLEEPEALADGSYMVFMRILQHPQVFGALSLEQQEQVIGRKQDGTRLDLAGQKVRPHQEPTSPPDALPLASHVRKSGPRGPHDDVTIFRRGLPFLDESGGMLEVGLNFVSFQASLDQFDVVFNDWAMNPRFPQEPAGVDALFDPNRGFTTFVKSGFYFVPPHEAGRFIGAVFFDEARERRRRTTGRVAVRKRVTDPANPQHRFERHGFQFQVFDSQGNPVGQPFVTDSAGHALSPELEIGKSYELREHSSPVANVALQTIPFTLEQRRMALPVHNVVTAPSPYGGAQ